MSVAAAPEAPAQMLPEGRITDWAPRDVSPLATLPEDIELPSILPHREVFDFFGNVADRLARFPADALGWIFDGDRPWWKD